MIDVSWAVLGIILALIAGVGIGTYSGFRAGFEAGCNKIKLSRKRDT